MFWSFLKIYIYVYIYPETFLFNLKIYLLQKDTLQVIFEIFSQVKVLMSISSTD